MMLNICLDLIVFYIERKEKPKPNYPKTKRMGYLSVLKIFSPEVAFRRESVKEIAFDERFGAGSGRYLMGEENIYLYDCLKRGLKIYYEPVQIAKLREESSTCWVVHSDTAVCAEKGISVPGKHVHVSCDVLYV